MCGYGHVGPDSHYVTMGPTAQALTGLTHLVGLPDREPAGWSFSYLDHVGGYLGAFGVLDRARAPARHRRRPARGRLAAGAGHRARRTAAARPVGQRPLVAPARLPARQPARRRAAGCVPRARRRPVGRDLVQHRRALARVRRRARQSGLGRATSASRRSPDGWSTPTTSTATSRRGRRRGTATTSWTCCSSVGVPAGAVQDAADRVERDPQLAARGHFTTLASTEVGELPLEGVPFDLSATPTAHRRHDPPRSTGPRTRTATYVLRDVLGLPDDEIDRARTPRERCSDRHRERLERRRSPGSGRRARRRAGRVLRAPARRASAPTSIKLEPAEGAPSRHAGPYVDGRDGDPDASLNFWHFNVGQALRRSSRTTRPHPPDRARPPTW